MALKAFARRASMGINRLLTEGSCRFECCLGSELSTPRFRVLRVNEGLWRFSGGLCDQPPDENTRFICAGLTDGSQVRSCRVPDNPESTDWPPFPANGRAHLSVAGLDIILRPLPYRPTGPAG